MQMVIFSRVRTIAYAMLVVVSVQLHASILNTTAGIAFRSDENTVTTEPVRVARQILHAAKHGSSSDVREPGTTVIEQRPTRTEKQIRRWPIASFNSDSERVNIGTITSRGKSNSSEQCWVRSNCQLKASAQATRV